jgi:hypothetical protein
LGNDDHAGVLADVHDIDVAFLADRAVSAPSGIVVAVRTFETYPRRDLALVSVAALGLQSQPR